MFVEQIIFLSITVYPTEIKSYVFYVYFNQIIMIPFMYHTVLYHIIIISLYLNSEQFITLSIYLSLGMTLQCAGLFQMKTVADLHEGAADLGVHLVRELLLEVLYPLPHVLALLRVLDGSAVQWGIIQEVEKGRCCPILC